MEGGKGSGGEQAKNGEGACGWREASTWAEGREER